MVRSSPGCFADVVVQQQRDRVCRWQVVAVGVIMVVIAVVTGPAASRTPTRRGPRGATCTRASRYHGPGPDSQIGTQYSVLHTPYTTSLPACPRREAAPASSTARTATVVRLVHSRAFQRSVISSGNYPMASRPRDTGRRPGPRRQVPGPMGSTAALAAALTTAAERWIWSSVRLMFVSVGPTHFTFPEPHSRAGPDEQLLQSRSSLNSPSVCHMHVCHHRHVALSRLTSPLPSLLQLAG